MNQLLRIFCLATIAVGWMAWPTSAAYVTVWTGTVDQDFINDANWTAGITAPDAVPLITTTGAGSPIISSGTIAALQTWIGINNAAGTGSGYLLQTGGDFSNAQGVVVGGSGVAEQSTYRIEGGTCTTPWIFWVGGDGNDTGAGTNYGNGRLEMTGGTLTTTGGWDIEVGYYGGTGQVDLSGVGTINCGSSFKVGDSMAADAPGTGTMTIGSATGTASLTVAGHLYVGRNGGHGELNINDGASVHVMNYVVVGHAEGGWRARLAW